jgi:hypothetical protein
MEYIYIYCIIYGDYIWKLYLTWAQTRGPDPGPGPGAAGLVGSERAAPGPQAQGPALGPGPGPM